MNQTDFLLKCADYPEHDYECMDCNTKIYGVIADLKACSACKSSNITYMGVPQGKGDL